jgi:Putative adhesin
MKARHFAGVLIVSLGSVSMACGSVALATTSTQSIPAPPPQQPADQVTIPLSDPSRPGLIDVSLVHGSITVRGTNRKDVRVTAHPAAERPSRRLDPDATGLRRIPQTAGFRISEESNRITISSDNPNRAISFEIEAPARTNLRVSTVNGGEILVESIDGDLDVSNTNGGITLNEVAGSVNAGTTNGNVRATMTRVAAEKAMAFTSLNGRVDVTLPPATKANLRLRSDRGDVYSDFDVQLAPSAPMVQEDRSSSNGRYRISRNRSIVGAINGGGPEFELRTFNSNVYVRKGK